MSLSTSYNLFVSKVKSSFVNSKSNSVHSTTNSDVVIDNLANDLSQSIFLFINNASIITNDIINAGQIDLPGNGITNIPGNGSGNGSFVDLQLYIPILKNEIGNSFRILRNASSNQASEVNSDSNLLILATELSTSIKKFIEISKINTNVLVNPGQIALSTFGTGIYTTPGTGKGIGSVTFSDTSKLKLSLFNAFVKNRNDGQKTNSDSMSIINSLANDLCQAIYEFCQTGIVNCNIVINPGVIVTGYVSLAGIPIVSTSTAGTGKSTGRMI